MNNNAIKLSALFVLVALFVSGCGTATVDADAAQVSAEKVVEVFYQGLIDGDAPMALVHPDAQSEVEDDLNDMKEWDYINVEVLEYNDPYVTIDFTVEIDGDEDGGEDEVKVKEEDGKWWILEIPS